MTKREELEAALAAAETTLAEAVMMVSKYGSVSDETNNRLEDARARCRRARKALLELDKAESAMSTHVAIDAVIMELKQLPVRGAASRASSRRSGEQAFRGKDRRSENKDRRSVGKDRRSEDRSTQRRPTYFNKGFLAQNLGPKDAVARRLLIRQAIGFLVLILTYLLYFHIDVQLQILLLPSIFPG